MPPPCLHCDRALHETCCCYWLRTHRRAQRSLPLQEDKYDQFRTERAALGKAYDDAIEEENRLDRLYQKARDRRFRLGREFEHWMMPASKKLLYKVMRVTELRNDIFSLLLPGEVDAFYTSCGHALDIDRQQIAADLSPLRVILSGGKRLHTLARDGYDMTVISGSKEMLLQGLSSLPPCDGLGRKKVRCWSAVLTARKAFRFVSCSAAFLPLSEFGCPGLLADSMEEYVDQDQLSRTVTLNYGPDAMSIWMPLCERSPDAPITIPHSVFHSFVATKYKAWMRQYALYYSHLSESDSSVRGPLEDSKGLLRKAREDVSEVSRLTIEVALKGHPFETASKICFELGEPLSEVRKGRMNPGCFRSI